MNKVDIYDYVENNDEDQDSMRKTDRGMQIKINQNEAYVILNQIRINA